MLSLSLSIVLLLSFVVSPALSGDPLVVAYYDFDPKFILANGNAQDLTGNGHDAVLRGDASLSPLTRLNPYANLALTSSNASLIIGDLPFYGFGTFFAVWLKISNVTATSVGGKARTVVKSGTLEVRCLQSLSSLYLDVSGEWNALMPLGLGMWFFAIVGFDSAGLYVNVVQSDVVHILLREERPVVLKKEPHTGFVLGGDFTFEGLVDNLYILRSNVADELMTVEFANKLGSVDYRFAVPVGASDAASHAAALAAIAHDADARDARDAAAAAAVVPRRIAPDQLVVGGLLGAAALAVATLATIGCIVLVLAERRDKRRPQQPAPPLIAKQSSKV